MANHGIFVGINNYASAGLNSLKGCVNDAVKMHDVLTNEKTGLIQSENTVQFLNEKATKNNIINQINEFVSKLNQDDSLTITWSSHGTRPDGDKQECYLMAYDTVVENGMPKENAIKFIEDLVPIFQNSNSYIIVILDGCQVGDALARPIIANNENIGIISASKREELAFEDTTLKHGVFTYHLLKTFTSIAVDSDDDGYISIEEAFAYTYRPVVDYVMKKYNRKQHPTSAGNNIHRMNLIKQASEKDIPEFSIFFDSNPKEDESSRDRMIPR
ncbi:MAG: caspase family protein [Cyanobacteria bacterium P01_C01_bin.38]